MKSLSLIFALAALTLVPALPSCTYSNVLHRQENGMAVLREALVHVNDQASADAAALVVKKYSGQLRGDIGVLLANGRPSILQLAMLRTSYQDSSISTEAKGVMREFFRLYGQSFYGSTALRQSFTDMLKAGR